MNGTDAWTLLTILGLAALTVLTRCFFFLFDQPWTLAPWVQRGLVYAPMAALSAVVLPEVLTVQGHAISHWQDARPWAAALGVAYYFWRRGVMGTIVVGMAVYLPLHIGLGW